MAKGKKQKARSKKKGRTPGVPAAGRVRMELVAIERIREAAYNPRKRLRPGDEGWEDLVRSVKTFGYIDPLIWNEKSGNLVGGHQRLAVLRSLNPDMKQVHVSVVAFDEATEKAANLALNKIKGEWDDGRLAALLEELAKTDVAGLTGFSDEEIAAIVDEGERLMEVLVPRDEETRNSKLETRKEEEGGGGGAGREPTTFCLLVRCGSEKKQKRLFADLSDKGFDCELRTS